ncbi:MAG: TrbC/VirB2 family protein [Alphaproteobacteria bacterium]|nr:TrbC/VirB2 family protein [Alphaproteobacteria bacterium]
MHRKAARTITASWPCGNHIDHLNRVIFFSVIVYFLMIACVYANCQNNPAQTPMGDVLCRVVDFMYGNLGRGLATLAVITLGVGALLGKVSWGMAVTVGVGIAVIFNAETITAMLLGCGASNTFCN